MSVFSVTGGRYTEWATGDFVAPVQHLVEPIPAPPPDETVEDVDNDPVEDEPPEDPNA